MSQFSFSDAEGQVYEIESMRRFAGITIDTVPDETTILNFRSFLEEHSLGDKKSCLAG